MSAQVILITGAATGFGRLTAIHLAEAGHTVYASMRDIAGRNATAAAELRAFATEHSLGIIPLELDVLSDASCTTAVSTILAAHGRVDVLVNNAAMLMIGVTEAFTPAQLQRIFDTNVVSILRVNRAVLPHMRRAGRGLVVYIGSVTSRIISPFQGPYVASKAAADALAETMHYENTPYGIDSVIIQPGAFTTGTNHFGGAQPAADDAVTAQYDRIASLPAALASRLESLNMPGVSTHPITVANAVSGVIATPPGQRPFRIVVDPQHHGAAEVNEVASRMQRKFMQRFGIDYLMQVNP